MRKIYAQLLAGVLALVVLYYASGGYVSQLAILPGFEGAKAGVEGFQPKDDQTYLLTESLPEPYEWSNKDPRQTDIKHNGYTGGLIWPNSDLYGHIRLRVSEPEKFTSGFEIPEQIEYWVQRGDEWVHVVGEVKIYRIYLSLKTLEDSFRYVWSGERFWVGLSSVTWDRASADPTNTEKWGKTWEAPLAVFIVSSDIQSGGSSHTGFEPSKGGDPVTLYTSPEQRGLISDLGLSSASINSTLTNEYAPDTRLSRQAYFALSLTDWGADIGLFGWSKSYPSANIQVKLYTIVIGTYVYTNPEVVDWEKDQAVKGGWGAGFIDTLNGFVSWLQSPWGQGMFGLIVVAVIAVAAAYMLGPVLRRIA